MYMFNYILIKIVFCNYDFFKKLFSNQTLYLAGTSCLKFKKIVFLIVISSKLIILHNTIYPIFE